MSEIVIENLYKSFDTKDGKVEALKNVNLSIESGDIYGIIGMSGAGKSTLVRCINFLEVPTKGRVIRRLYFKRVKKAKRRYRNDFPAF